VSFTFAPRSRFDRDTGGRGETAKHIVLLARNIQGYRNLVRLSSLGYLEGFYYKPRIDKELLAQSNEGLIGLSACLHGEVSEHLLRGDEDAAMKAASAYRDILGDGHFYLEIMENGIPEQKEVNKGLMEIGRKPRHPPRRDKRLPLPQQGRRGGPRDTPLHPDREDGRRRRPHEVRHRRILL